MNVAVVISQYLHNIANFFNNPTMGMQNNQQGFSPFL